MICRTSKIAEGFNNDFPDGFNKQPVNEYCDMVD